MGGIYSCELSYKIIQNDQPTVTVQTYLTAHTPRRTKHRHPIPLKAYRLVSPSCSPLHRYSHSPQDSTSARAGKKSTNSTHSHHHINLVFEVWPCKKPFLGGSYPPDQDPCSFQTTIFPHLSSSEFRRKESPGQQ